MFARKYRRKVFYESKRWELGANLQDLCKWKDEEIIQAEARPDHIRMLVSIPPKMSLSSFMGFSQREEQSDDIREMGRPKDQIQEQRILVQGILRRHGRKRCGKNQGTHREC